MRIQSVVRECSVQLSIAYLLSLLPSHWESLQDTDTSVTIGTELRPCWRWPGRDEAIRDVVAGCPGGGCCCGQSMVRGAGDSCFPLPPA